MTDNTKIISGLKKLLVRAVDGEKGYNNSRTLTDNMALQMFFNRKSKQRRYFAHELRNEIVRLGGKLDTDGGSFLGDFHRGWMEIKTALTSNNEEAVLDACETGEKAALEAYDEFLGENQLDPKTAAMIENQRNHIAMSLRTVDQLEDQYEEIG